jgi:SSS family solute:Na+ symporter
VQWWSVWYPGAEPGGGGYVAQRMLAARDEGHAVGATMLFNVAHYALRSWPWIIVALASLVVFPDLASLREAFPNMPAEIVKNDMAYPAMLTFLPAGLLGIVIASLVAAVMSTISTHLNWGASYIVNDFWRRFISREPSERQLVWLGRISIAVLMVLATMLALLLRNALQAFHILLQIGAGTGLLFLLRWFWWRINAFSELAAMVISFLVAVYFEFIHVHLGLPELVEWQRLVIGVAVTTVGWVAVTLFTRPTDTATLIRFHRLVHAGGPGWRRVIEAAGPADIAEAKARGWNLPRGLVNVVLGLVLVYGALFATGFWLYGNTAPALITTVAGAAAGLMLLWSWRIKGAL